MRYAWPLILLAALSVMGCGPEVEPRFLITANAVGPIDVETTESEIPELFPGDSIVTDSMDLSLGKFRKRIQIFEKGGSLLLTLTPNEDPDTTISNIRIHDVRFKTLNGIHSESSFKELKSAFEIKKVVTASKNVVIFLKGTDLYVTIDKAELPENIRYTTTDVEAVQIPDQARFKYLMMGW